LNKLLIGVIIFVVAAMDMNQGIINKLF